MKNKYLLQLFISVLAFGILACSDDIQEITLNVGENEIFFDSSDAQNKEVTIETNSSSITIDIQEDGRKWCSARRYDNIIYISVTKNTIVGDNRKTSITITAREGETRTILVTQAASDKYISSFIIPADINNLKADINGVINNKEKTITISTSAWIGNVKNLIAQFETQGKLYIGETEQISGVTPNSFLDKITYTVKTANGFSADYVLIAEGAMFTGLPIIKVDIEGGAEVVEKTVKLPAVFQLIDPSDKGFDIDLTAMKIRGRGNSTWVMPKKPYRVDFPQETSLFGLPKAKKWVLLANYQDPTLIMNDVAFKLGRMFGLEFNHSSIHVELFINGRHRGNYQLTEQKEVGEGRVDIDTNGGFLVEMDSYYDEDYKFKTSILKLPVMVTDPSLNNESEMEYIKEAFRGLEDALFGESFPDISFENHTDVNSLINFMLINELVRNQELDHPKSTYCYKEKNTKIKWGPLWDFDWAFGYNESNDYFIRNNLLFYKGKSDSRPGARFFSRFMEVPEFRTKYKARWKEMKPELVKIIDHIDMMAAKLDKSQAENFKNPTNTPNTKNKSYQDLIKNMKEWINDRIVFLDSEINKM